MYQKKLQQILQGCPCEHNIMDNIIAHGRTQPEHDSHLENVLKVLISKQITLSAEKCQFSVPELTFMGNVLSKLMQSSYEYVTTS